MTVSAYRLTGTITALIAKGSRERLGCLEPGAILIPTSNTDKARVFNPRSSAAIHSNEFFNTLMSVSLPGGRAKIEMKIKDLPVAASLTFEGGACAALGFEEGLVEQGNRIRTERGGMSAASRSHQLNH